MLSKNKKIPFFYTKNLVFVFTRILLIYFINCMQCILRKITLYFFPRISSLLFIVNFHDIQLDFLQKIPFIVAKLKCEDKNELLRRMCSYNILHRNAHIFSNIQCILNFNGYTMFIAHFVKLRKKASHVVENHPCYKKKYHL